MTKKIFYLMHVNWNWIKQRPHFLAENLSKFYEVHVFYPHYYLFKEKFMVQNDVKEVEVHPILRLPLDRKNMHIFDLNKLILKIYFKWLFKKHNPDYIWITFPFLLEYIPDNINCKIIYDCMDDMAEFEMDQEFKERLMVLEKKLIEKASIIFVSANKLALKLNERQKCANKIVLCRNAFDGDILKDSYNNKNPNVYKIGYVGTISSWFDWDSLNFTLENIDNIEYHIIGPMDIDPNITLNNRIKFYGPINHKDLNDYIKNFDCLIMPFKVNELILSVDPVKLYEYINNNKPIISIFYEEIKRFDPFVSFYTNKEELLSVLNDLIEKKFSIKYSNEQRINFLKNNSWNVRTSKINKHLEKIDE